MWAQGVVGVCCQVLNSRRESGPWHGHCVWILLRWMIGCLGAGTARQCVMLQLPHSTAGITNHALGRAPLQPLRQRLQSYSQALRMMVLLPVGR
jgi:hypothetical protein